MAWRCRFLAARRSQHGRVIVEKCAPDTLVDFHTGEHHNVQTTRAYDCDCENPNPTVAAIVGGAWEWMSGFRGWCAGDLGSFSRHWQLIYGDELCGSQFSAMTRPCWLHRVVMDRQRHAIEQASRRWRGGRRGDSA